MARGFSLYPIDGPSQTKEIPRLNGERRSSGHCCFQMKKLIGRQIPNHEFGENKTKSKSQY
jgi:hypothetical protein